MFSFHLYDHKKDIEPVLYIVFKNNFALEAIFFGVFFMVIKSK